MYKFKDKEPQAPNANTKAVVENNLQFVDVDNNGFISKQDLTAFVEQRIPIHGVNINILPTDRDKENAATYDKNNDGILSRPEYLKAVINELHESLSKYGEQGIPIETPERQHIPALVSANKGLLRE